MNFVFLSPHFPPNYFLFPVRLRELGATVLGLADERYDCLRGELRGSLNEYYRVDDMHDRRALLDAMNHFTRMFGPLGGIDSFNEYWLETEAWLRFECGIEGPLPADMPRFRRKSLMREVFASCGVATAPGTLIDTPERARAFAAEAGFPLVAKPDIGVGAHGAHRFDDAGQLDAFLGAGLPPGYYLERFVEGSIETYDGLTDRNGEVVFEASLEYSRGIMETVNEDSEVYYFTRREIPADLAAAGRAVAKAYGLRGRFFHFEFFRAPDGGLVGLEVNMRPPGGLTTDMWNFADDIDIYREWANVTMGRPFSAVCTRPYHCAYISRKRRFRYRHSHDELLAFFGDRLVHHEEIAGVFAGALGDHGYVVRTPEVDEIHRMASLAQTRERIG